MRVLFIVCAVLGTVGICGLLIMLLFFRLKINLGFRLPKGKTIPIEQFIPQGIYGYMVFMAAFGYSDFCCYRCRFRGTLSCLPI